MKHLKLFEEYNVQDIMSIPTFISFMHNQIQDQGRSLAIPDVKINVPGREYMEQILPYYNFVKKNTPMVSKISHEKEQNVVGFCFKLKDKTYAILLDLNLSEFFLILDSEFIPIKNVNDVIKILNSHK